MDNVQPIMLNNATKYDYLKDIANEGIKLSSLVNLDITEQEIEQILLARN